MPTRHPDVAAYVVYVLDYSSPFDQSVGPLSINGSARCCRCLTGIQEIQEATVSFSTRMLGRRTCGTSFPS